MKNKFSVKLMAVLLAGMMAAASLTACGGSKPAASSSAPASSAASSAAAEGADESTADGSAAESTEAAVTGTFAPEKVQKADGSEEAYLDFTSAVLQSKGVASDSDDYKNAMAIAQSATYTFKEDGTISGTVSGAEFSGTYKLSGTALTMTINGSDTKFEYDKDANVLKQADSTSGEQVTIIYSAK